MKNIILFDEKSTRDNLLPLTFTRPVAGLRFGICTIAEKWQHAITGNYSFLAADYLQAKFPISLNEDDNIFIAGNICPNDELISSIENLPLNSAITHGDDLLAFRGNINDFNSRKWEQETTIETLRLPLKCYMISSPSTTLPYAKILMQ